MSVEKDDYLFYEKLIALVTFGIMIVVGTATVLARFFFGFAIVWSEELMRWSLVLATFWGSVTAHRKDTHCRIGEVLERFMPNWKPAIKLFEEVCIVVFLIILIWAGIQVTTATWNVKTVTLGTSVGLFFCVIPVTAGCMLLFSIRRMFSILISSSKKRTALN